MLDERLLHKHHLGPSDLKRLQRQWQARFEADPELAEQARKLASSPPAPPARLEVGPAELRPFPWSPSTEQAQSACALEPVAFLASTAKGAHEPEGPILPFAGYRPPPPGTLEIEHTPMLGETAPVGRGKLQLPATPWEPVVQAVADPAPHAIAMPKPPPSPDSAQRPDPLEPVASLATTAGVHPPSQPTLPFAGRQPPPAPVSWDLEPVADMGLTAPRGARLPETATPFDGPGPSALEPNAMLAATTPVSSSPKGPALPFSGQRAAPPSALASLEPVAELGQTAPLGEPASRWTPEHYGRLCAELDAAGPQRSEVLARWGIAGEPQLRALEQYWLGCFQRDPALRTRFAAALAQARTI